ncbi:MAG: TonB family protein [Sedimenticola selenatireducens]|uniref:TonB family protein n=2 Tax=Sedimenticola selenatireducens TaxID=191960 RepID=A0A557S385_9GAMM|nr:TonB family protein [Sedimenticola selenatireducens]TVT66343.1 MAG: TonB family protein [Sedimenticola selenatireducens]
MRNLYVTQLLKHIEQFKNYPLPARKRNIEGQVKVSFSLSASGILSGLQVTGGHALLNKATQRALERALPLPPSQVPVEWPIQVSFYLKYSLSM